MDARTCVAKVVTADPTSSLPEGGWPRGLEVVAKSRCNDIDSRIGRKEQ